MTDMSTGVHARGGMLDIPRSRGAASGFLLILLGAWGALIPFVGPYFSFAYSPDQEWTWNVARGWLEVLPGAAAALGGLLLLASANRATTMFGGWLAVLGGAWFVVGPVVAAWFRISDVGAPVASTDAKRAVLELTYFYGLGAVIVFLGAVALGRLSVRSVRDVGYVGHPVAAEPQSAPTAEPTTVQQPQHAAAEAEEGRHRMFGDLFRRRHTTAAHR